MSKEKKISNIIIEDARIILKNFAGKRSEYNTSGKRTFGLIIPDEDYAQALAEDGWRIRRTKPSEDAPDGAPWIKVNVRFDNIPPIIQLITEDERVRLDEDTVEQLDWSHFRNVDVVISPSRYKPFGNTPGGITAYLKAMYVTLEEDEFATKYKNIPLR